jgi:hypothetical protein
MSTSWKCAECGLVNFAAATNCKRCAATRSVAGSPAPSQPTGIVLEDGYVLPPPPAGGVWRDKSTLVMTKDASLPDRCVKCNAPANGVRLKRNFSWHHPLFYLFLLLALLIYAIIAGIVSKRATVFVGLCPRHFARRRGNIALGWILLVGGFFSAMVAFANNYPLVGVLGLVVFLFALIWLIVVSRVVTVKKIDDRLVWLNGINYSYLSQLPPWQSQA